MGQPTDGTGPLKAVSRRWPAGSQLREDLHKGGRVLGPREVIPPVDDKVRHARHSRCVQLQLVLHLQPATPPVSCMLADKDMAEDFAGKELCQGTLRCPANSMKSLCKMLTA